MQCTNNLKQIGLALHNYESSHKVFPPGYITSNTASLHTQNPKKYGNADTSGITQDIPEDGLSDLKIDLE